MLNTQFAQFFRSGNRRRVRESECSAEEFKQIDDRAYTDLLFRPQPFPPRYEFGSDNDFGLHGLLFH
jgi:hypothetical protein